MFKLGDPKNFSNNRRLRFEQIKLANKRFVQIKAQRLARISAKIDKSAKLYIKGCGNDAELISCFRELLFNSRELLDSLIYDIHKKTQEKTKKNFLQFAKKLMKNEYDNLKLDVISVLKTNITYIFHIRKFRNEIKSNISNIEFRFVYRSNTNYFQATFRVPIKPDEKELIPFLDIKNKKAAIERNSYRCTISLDKYFPEMVAFWTSMFNIIDHSLC